VEKDPEGIIQVAMRARPIRKNRSTRVWGTLNFKWFGFKWIFWLMKNNKNTDNLLGEIRGMFSVKFCLMDNEPLKFSVRISILKPLPNNHYQMYPCRIKQ